MLKCEYGPWIDHDGRGRPVPVGTVVEVEAENITGLVTVITSVAMADAGSAWDWSSVCLDQPWRATRYRVRKPRGMTVLDRILTSVSETVEA